MSTDQYPSLTPLPAYLHQAEEQPKPQREKRSFFRWVGQAPIHAGLLLWGLFCIFPLFWVIITSLKSTPDLYSHPFGIPQIVKWSNYRDAWVFAKMGTYFINSA